MLIDWFTVCAQAINFLILVWLMRRFLYKPILNAIATRENLVAKELANADAMKAVAEKEHEEFKHKNEQFDKHHAAMLIKANNEVKAERSRLVREAEEAADDLNAKRREAQLNDAEKLNASLKARVQKEVFAIARRTLSDLASASLEERMSEVFIQRLKDIGPEAKEDLKQALKSAHDPPLARSTFDLPAKQRTAIQAALKETLSASVDIRFETAPDQVGGIELTVGGQKLAWSISEYLESLEKNVTGVLTEKDTPNATAAPTPAASATQ
jgi:F-type H+-transporting ATPase subunit b